MLILNNLKYNLLKKTKPVLQKLHPIFNEYGIFLLIFFVEFFLIRIFEFFYLKNSMNIPFSSILNEINGIYYDYILVAFLSTICIIPFTFFYKLSRKLSQIIFYVFNTVIIIICLTLIDYLKHTFILLDHAILAYPIKELLYITKESIEFTFIKLAKYLIAVIIGLLLTNIFLSKIRYSKLYLISLIFIFSGVFLTQNLNPVRNKFSNDISFNLTVNKFSYFSKSCVKHIVGKSDITAIDFNKKALGFQEINPEFQFTSQRYPFEHKPDTTDLLGSYFSINEDPPNLVFIIMESLSRAFCGNDAYLCSFTPFIDSLIQYSLYWENALSTSERTFNAIPSIFGSLPYGEKGFMSQVQSDYTVRHSTLIKWLNYNGYQTNFFYGGWTGFDNMKRFMKYQDTDFILKHFSSEYSKIEKDKNGLSWGYPDGSVYSRSFEVLDSIQKEPRLDIYLTLSLHHPFRPPNKELYYEKFLERMEEINMTNKQNEEIQDFSGVFSTILYTDDALRSFFNQYKKRDDYKNTIFIITGDHRISLPYTRNNIDIYHVPLIIFSPMLKETVKFSSVSSHANITPTLFPFLSKNFNFRMPEKVHWLGKQIDFSKNFRNIHITPFMKINREITDYLSGEYFLSNSNLYLLKDGLRLQRIENPKVIDSITDNLNNFIFLNQYLINNNLLISDE